MSEREEPCYKDWCPQEIFGHCDDCIRAGCVNHLTITSKFEEPFMYLCEDCLKKRREAKRKEQ